MVVTTLPESKRWSSPLPRGGRRKGMTTDPSDDNTERLSDASTHSLRPRITISNLVQLQPVGTFLRDGILRKFHHPATPPGMIKKKKRTQHIFASDMVSEDFMEDIRSDTRIVGLEIEDLITDKRYRSLVSTLVRLIVRSTDREWEKLSFVDFVAPEEWSTWRGHKHAVMGGLVDCFDLDSTGRPSLSQDHVEFRAIIEFAPGTNIKTFLDTLRSINHHNLVRSVDFFGALFHCDKSNITAKLMECVDKHGELSTSIRVEVICGLVDNPERFELLEMCLQKGRDIANKALAMDSSSSRSIQPPGRAFGEGGSNAEPQSPIRESRGNNSNNKRRLRSARRPTTTKRTVNSVNNTKTTPYYPTPSRKTTRTNRRRRESVAVTSPTSVVDLYIEGNGTGAKTNEKETAKIEASSLPLMMPLPQALGGEDSGLLDSNVAVVSAGPSLHASAPDLTATTEEAMHFNDETVRSPSAGPTRRRAKKATRGNAVAPNPALVAAKDQSKKKPLTSKKRVSRAEKQANKQTKEQSSIRKARIGDDFEAAEDDVVVFTHGCEW